MADPHRVRGQLESQIVLDAVLEEIGIAPRDLPLDVRARIEDRVRYSDRRLAVGRYLILGELGRGGMGVVYEGWDPGIERRVAIKTIEPAKIPDDEQEEVIERFRRETRTLGRLHHPSIVAVYDAGQETSTDDAAEEPVSLLYYVMEFIEGESLSEVLKRRRMLTDGEAVRIALDIADALDVAHRAGIVHRDIKPSNIFLRGGQKAVLLDFGIAKTRSPAITKMGEILGTPSYLAPERLREKQIEVDGRADIFSLGVLLFAMVTGEAPFVGDDVYEVIDKIARTEPPKLKEGGRARSALSAIIQRMLAKDPRSRYQTAGDVGNALRTVLAALDLEAGLRLDTDDQAPSSAIKDRFGHVPEPPDARMTIVSRMSPVAREEERLRDELRDASEDVIPSDEILSSEDTPRSNPEEGSFANPTAVASDLLIDDAEATPAEAMPAEATSGEYAAHSPETDETTDDDTLADPPRGPAQDHAKPSPPQKLIPTDEVEPVNPLSRPASGPRGRDAVLKERGPISQSSMLPVGATPSPFSRGPNARGGRVEAAQVDEADVLVRPITLDAHAAEELPTVATEPRGSGDRDREATSDEGVFLPLMANQPVVGQDRAAAADPAEPLASRGGEAVPDRTRALVLPARPDSAAIARKTIGAKARTVAVRTPPLGIRVESKGLAQDHARTQMLRRRLVVLLAGALASVAVGLWLGRTRRAALETRPAPTLASQPPTHPKVEVRPAVKRADERAPPSLDGLMEEAEQAADRGDLATSIAAYDQVLRVSKPDEGLFLRASLGRADLLRQQRSLDAASLAYRQIIEAAPRSPEAGRARVSLREMAPPTATESPRSASDRAPPRAPAGPVRALDTPKVDETTLPADQRCALIVRRNLDAPQAAIRELGALRRDHPKAPCVHWHLGVQYQKLGDLLAAKTAFRRYLMLEPESEKREAVEQRIESLDSRLENR